MSLSLPIRAATLLVAAAALLSSSCAKADADSTTQDQAGTSTTSTVDSALVFNADRGRTMGDSSAPIWIVMISDFQCPYCKQFHDGALKEVISDYVNTGRARLAYLHLPLRQHAHSRPAARASLCASAQGKFWQYADSVFAAQQRLETSASSTQLLNGFAQSLSLDMPAFHSCVESAAIENMLQVDIQQATRAGVKSTPSFFVGDFLVEGNAPYNYFRQAIDSALAVAARKPAEETRDITRDITGSNR